jgi:hypothetical protein
MTTYRKGGDNRPQIGKGKKKGRKKKKIRRGSQRRRGVEREEIGGAEKEEEKGG